jgi:hypothetical protein
VFSDEQQNQSPRAEVEDRAVDEGAYTRAKLKGLGSLAPPGIAATLSLLGLWGSWDY